MSAHSLKRVAEFEDFSSAEPEHQYGVLPWRKDRRGDLQVLLITSRGRGRWIVPKGWPARDRAPYLSAALEAFEEAGVIGEVLSHPFARYDYIKEGEDGLRQPRRVTLFSLRVIGTLTNWPERGQRKRKWVSLTEAIEMADDLELARIISDVREDPDILAKEDSKGSDIGCRLEAALPS